MTRNYLGQRTNSTAHCSFRPRSDSIDFGASDFHVHPSARSADRVSKRRADLGQPLRVQQFARALNFETPEVEETDAELEEVDVESEGTEVESKSTAVAEAQ